LPLYRVGWSTPRQGFFTPGKDPVRIVQEAGWAPGPVWTGAEYLAPPPGFDPRTVQPVASRNTVRAIPLLNQKLCISLSMVFLWHYSPSRS